MIGSGDRTNYFGTSHLTEFISICVLNQAHESGFDVHLHIVETLSLSLSLSLSQSGDVSSDDLCLGFFSSIFIKGGVR